jgi:hypothetical protein
MKPYSASVVIDIYELDSSKQIFGGFIMKRTILSLILISCVLSFVPAQEHNRRGQRGPGGQPSPESVSVSGNLTIVRGTIAVVSGDITYLAGGLQRFVGFIDGLKEGAAVKLEGNAIPAPQNDKVKFLQVKKMTLSGKDYDLDLPRMSTPGQRGHQAAPGQMGQRGPQPMYRQRQGRGCEPFYNNQNRRQPMRRGK